MTTSIYHLYWKRSERLQKY